MFGPLHVSRPSRHQALARYNQPWPQRHRRHRPLHATGVTAPKRQLSFVAGIRHRHQHRNRAALPLCLPWLKRPWCLSAVCTFCRLCGATAVPRKLQRRCAIELPSTCLSHQHLPSPVDSSVSQPPQDCPVDLCHG